MEYVRAHHWIDANSVEVSSGEVTRLAPRLHDPCVPVGEKKFLLLLFAHAEPEAALVAIEAFVPFAGSSLRDFARFALEEARERRKIPEHGLESIVGRHAA